MTYPDTAGFQSHSETSREAAEKLNAGTLCAEILDSIEIAGYFGRTADELSMQFDTPQSTIGARLRELELADQVIKTKIKRKTRYDRNAFVYVHPDHYKPRMGKATVKQAQNYDIIKLAAENERYRAALDEIITICDYESSANCGVIVSYAIEAVEDVAREALGNE